MLGYLSNRIQGWYWVQRWKLIRMLIPPGYKIIPKFETIRPYRAERPWRKSL